MRRRQQSKLLWLGLIFLLGVLLGWLVLGWLLFPSTDNASLRDLSADARFEYVTMVSEAWGANRDTARAQEQLRGFDPGEVRDTLRALVAEQQLEGQAQDAARVQAFASSLGLSLEEAGMPRQPEPNRTGPTRVGIAENVPRAVRAVIEEWARAHSATLIPSGETAEVNIGTEPQPRALLLSERVYVVVDWFPTGRMGITEAALRGLWQGQAADGGPETLLVTQDSAEALQLRWGNPGANVQVTPFDSLVSRLWNAHSSPSAGGTALAVVPFDLLIPKLTALSLDGQNVLSHDFRVEAYPLVTRTYLSGDTKLALNLLAALRPKLTQTNRDPERLTTLIMTGTTAIARTAGVKIEEKQDPAFPARLIAPILAAADLTHVSNEVSFVDGCIPVLNTMMFCSKPSYLATFKLAGVKLVSLTGNHLVDYGAAPFLKTLDLYDANGMRYYGGGRNAKEASRTLFVQDHGNRLAFLGANSLGPAGDWATADRPGARQYNAEAMRKDIAEARAQADVVLVDMQAEETYDYQPSRNNQLQFRALLAAGADVVTGVQAHQPQALEFSVDGRRLILYGLGNLFFDQMFQLSVRQGLVARHTIYAGHLIQTELLTTVLEDSVQPRWTTPSERAALLKSVFTASGFQP